MLKKMNLTSLLSKQLNGEYVYNYARTHLDFLHCQVITVLHHLSQWNLHEQRRDPYTAGHSGVPAVQPGFAQESQLRCSSPSSQPPSTRTLPVTSSSILLLKAQVSSGMCR